MKLISTAIASICDGDEINELGIESLMAIKTPPPQKDLSLRYSGSIITIISRKGLVNLLQNGVANICINK